MIWEPLDDVGEPSPLTLLYCPRAAWLVVETSSEDWWVYDAINLVTGQPGGRTNEVFGTSYLIVTDQGVYLNGQNGP